MVFGFLSVFTSCNDSGQMIGEEGLYDGMEVRVNVTVDSPTSRATNITSDNIDYFGLVINRNGNADWTYDREFKRVKNGDIWGEWTINKELMWTNLNNMVEVVGYAPYLTTIMTTNGSGRKLTYQANTGANTEPIDWLYYYSGKVPMTTLLGRSGFVPVHFTHIMSRLRIEITTHGDLDESMQASAVEVMGTLPTVEWVNSSPSIVSAKGTATTVYATATGEATGVWSTFIVPQKIGASTFKIRVTLGNGEKYTYTYPTALDLRMGNAYKLTLDLGRNGLGLASDGVTVTDWEAGDEISGGKAEEIP